jgi:hypothetical protein
MERIVTAIDGSAASLNAVDFAADLVGNKVVLLRM